MTNFCSRIFNFKGLPRKDGNKYPQIIGIGPILVLKVSASIGIGQSFSWQTTKCNYKYPHLECIGKDRHWPILLL